MSKSRIEQETTMTYNAAEKEALVWSADPVFHRRMVKRGIAPYQISPSGEERWYKVPKNWVRVSPPIKQALSEAQREQLRQRLVRRKIGAPTA